jgi:hypothetical protein
LAAAILYNYMPQLTVHISAEWNGLALPIGFWTVPQEWIYACL